MTVAWPATVPTDVLEDSFAESPPENTIRSPMETGPAKLRRRATSAVRPVSWRQNLTTAQVADVDTFAVTTTKNGSIDFTRAHPRTGSSVTMRFLAMPSYAPAAGTPGRWLVSFSCEVLP